MHFLNDYLHLACFFNALKHDKFITLSMFFAISYVKKLIIFQLTRGIEWLPYSAESVRQRPRVEEEEHGRRQGHQRDQLAQSGKKENMLLRYKRYTRYFEDKRNLV